MPRWQVLPLAANGRRLGALQLCARHRGALTPEALERAREYGAQAAQALSSWAAQEEHLAGAGGGGGWGGMGQAFWWVGGRHEAGWRACCAAGGRQFTQTGPGTTRAKVIILK
jgi:hypothetical protein